MNIAAPDSPDPSSHAVRAIDAEASAWVVRRREGLDAAGERKLSAWLAADVTHAEAFARLSAMADALQRARNAGAERTIVTHLRIRERQRRRRRRICAAVGAAAVVLLGTGLWLHSPPVVQSIPTADMAAAAEWFRRLPDGSIVELNTGAEIAVKFEPGVRRIELVRGEALFRVEKDGTRPFVVHAARVEVRAVGTAFNVRLAGADVEVLVTEGRVIVADATHGHSLLPSATTEAAPVLVAGQAITVESGVSADLPPTVRVTQIAPTEVMERLAWRIPRVAFEGIELARAVDQFNRVNRRQIVIESDAIRTLRLSGTFRADDPHTFARLAAASLGLEVDERDNTEIVLRKMAVPRRPE